MRNAAGFAACMLIVLAGAAWLRLADLDNRPMHCDEAVQAVKFGRLLDTGRYVYDRFEYHGPSLAYFTLPVVWLWSVDDLEDADEIMLRIVPAGFGLLLVGLVWLLREQLGRTAACAAAVLTAVSPAMVFYSRYYIQEMVLVCASFAAIVAVCRLAMPNCMASMTAADSEKSDRPRCPGAVGRSLWLVMLGASLGLMHASKETSIIAVFAMIVAGGIAFWIWTETNSFSDRVSARRLALGGMVVVAVAGIVSGLLFSNFLKAPRGIADSYLTFVDYVGRAGGEGSVGQHAHPWHYYLELLFWWTNGNGPVWTEAAIAALALVGLLGGVMGRGIDPPHLPVVRFLSVYTLLMVVVYSAIPYKTPWCALGFLHGMILLGGVGAAILLRAVPGHCLKGLTTLALVATAGQLGWQAYRASFMECDRPNNPYTYAQPTEELLRCVAQIRRIAESSTLEQAIPIQVICRDDDYWPLPWYFRGYHQVGWFAEMPQGRPAPVIVTQPALVGTLTRYLYEDQPPGQRDLYMPVSSDRPDGLWQLRPHVPLKIYLRRDLFEKSEPGGH